MMQDKARPIRFGLVFVGLLFFFNPSFAVVDVLPDFIGCFLICVGLSRVSLIHPAMHDARTAFFKLAWVGLVKDLSLLVIFGAATGAEQPEALLLAAFATMTVSLLFLVPAVRSLFDGFSSFAITYDCVELYGNSLGGRSYTDRMEQLTLFFLIFREAVCLLPEFAALSTSSYSDSEMIRIYDYIGLLRISACILVGIAGIYWLIRLMLYYKKLCRQTPLLVGVGEKYQAYYEAHPGIAVQRRHGTAFLLLFAGALLLTDFYLDFQNILPDVLAGVLLLAGSLIPAIPWRQRIGATISAGVYAVISVISTRLSYLFVNQYSAGEIAKNPEASAAYTDMWIMALVEFLAFLALLVFLLLMLRAVIREWAGYRAQHTESEFEARYQTNLLAEFDGQLIRCFVFGFISGLLSFLYDYIKEMPGKGILHLFEFLWMFDFCAALLFAVMLGVLLSRIYGEIKNRFQYD